MALHFVIADVMVMVVVMFRCTRRAELQDKYFWTSIPKPSTRRTRTWRTNSLRRWPKRHGLASTRSSRSLDLAFRFVLLSLAQATKKSLEERSKAEKAAAKVQ